jgi:hypothetical protein
MQAFSLCTNWRYLFSTACARTSGDGQHHWEVLGLGMQGTTSSSRAKARLCSKCPWKLHVSETHSLLELLLPAKQLMGWSLGPQRRNEVKCVPESTPCIANLLSSPSNKSHWPSLSMPSMLRHWEVPGGGRKLISRLNLKGTHHIFSPPVTK